MQFDTASKLVTATKEIFPASKNDVDGTIDAWMGLFGNQDDGLMETAVRSCWLGSKFFPTPAEIFKAIKDLQYDEQVKPKQIPWDVKRDTTISDKAFRFVAEGKTAEYMASVDISNLHQYAKVHFPDISAEMVRKNYSELIEGYESMLRCSACRTGRNQCITQGWLVKHWINSKTGYVSNQMAQCLKNN